MAWLTKSSLIMSYGLCFMRKMSAANCKHSNSPLFPLTGGGTPTKQMIRCAHNKHTQTFLSAWGWNIRQRCSWWTATANSMLQHLSCFWFSGSAESPHIGVTGFTLLQPVLYTILLLFPFFKTSFIYELEFALRAANSSILKCRNRRLPGQIIWTCKNAVRSESLKSKFPWFVHSLMHHLLLFNSLKY